MVEFGLKLKDNKVAEWDHAYIDYEKLKILLKKARKSAEKLSVLESREPYLAAQVRASYKKSPGRRLSESSSLSGLPKTLSEASLQFLDTERTNANVTGEILEASGGDSGEGDPEFFSELIPIVDHSDHRHQPDADKYGSLSSKGAGSKVAGCMLLESSKRTEAEQEERDEIARTKSFNSEGGQSRTSGSMKRNRSLQYLSQAVSGVAVYFQQSDDATKLKDAMTETDERIAAFSLFLYNEIEKVNFFYKAKLNELDERLQVLIESGRALWNRAPAGDIMNNRGTFPSRTTTNNRANIPQVELADIEAQHQKDHSKAIKRNREFDSIKRAITDLYRTSKLLANFAIMNHTGFFKIIKKFDKNFPENKGKFKDEFEKVVCHEGKEAEELSDRMEKLFAEWFCGGNFLEARAQMLPKKGDSLQMDWSQMRLGFHLGMCAILALWICWDCIEYKAKGHSTIGGRMAFPVFRACGGLLLLHWLWGFSVFIWTRYRVNYIFLFDFNPRTVRTPIRIFNDVVDETLVYLVLMLVYFKAGEDALPQFVAIPPGCYALILVLYTLKKLFFPWRTRAPLWRAIREVITTPVKSPTFYTSYIGDIFTSMVKVFQDVLWTSCFILSGDFLRPEDDNTAYSWKHQFWYKNVLIPLICLAPLWFRFNQSLRRYVDTGKRWPNLANAFKYALSQTVTLFGAFHPLYLYAQRVSGSEGKEDSILMTTTSGTDIFQVFWVGLFVLSSLYSYFWDVYMDWGLGRPEYAFLGPRLMYPKRLHYYLVMFMDLFLRFMWVLTLVPPQSGASFELPSYLSAVTMSLELIRRTLWGFFRLENEHRHSTYGYRTVDFVPLHFSTGHDHEYKETSQHVGWHVLGEVAAVGLSVVGVMVTSVIAAQRTS